MSLESFASIPRCFASCSLGQSTDKLSDRLAHLSAAGFTQIELSMPDLVAFAAQYLGRDVKETDYHALCQAGEEVKKLCKTKGLQIFVLQPFANFEGWPEGSAERLDAFNRVAGWVAVMRAVGTDTLQVRQPACSLVFSTTPSLTALDPVQVGASDSEGINTSREYVVRDLGLLCDLLAIQGFRVAYENWCWSSHAPTWRDVYDLVDAVRRAGHPNIGLCLDSFQTAGSEWADPTRPDGLDDDPGRDARLARSLEDLSARVPADMIYFYQVSDAYRVEPPLEDKKVKGLRPRGRWSHDYRPLPFDGGYLPVVEVTRAVLKTGFRGTFSVEVFDGGKDGKGKDVNLEDFANKAKESLERLLRECAKE
ncbi:SPOSA6832_00517 [Sporobolomyces salmonicolor]|uniref:SPOSA6832_00517-mRNA-1:cds n=1 Tax=Sporidiobolus salmonicolor TaxID=5005 RepID=A0A0D6EGU5_SPOSA|nr:SPOSA6832_00517 [Sporobolomyces salmonicolor]